MLRMVPLPVPGRIADGRFPPHSCFAQMRAKDAYRWLEYRTVESDGKWRARQDSNLRPPA